MRPTSHGAQNATPPPPDYEVFVANANSTEAEKPWFKWTNIHPEVTNQPESLVRVPIPDTAEALNFLLSQSLSF